jgi:outer membrane protein TolC
MMVISRLSRIILLLGLISPIRTAFCQDLESYLSKGLANSPLIRDYSLQGQSALLDSLKVLAGYKPQAGLSGEIMYPPAFGKVAYDSAITDGGHYISLVRVDQELFTRKNSKAKLQNVLIQRLLANNGLKATEMELKESITAQFVTAYSDLVQFEFSKKLTGMLYEQLDILKRLVEKGLYQQTDYLNLKISVESGRISSKQAFRQYKNDLALLNLICGIHDTTTVYLEKPELQVSRVFDIHSSPGMVRFRIDSLRNVTDRLLLEMNYRPRVGAYIDAGFNSTNPIRIPYHVGTSFGLSLSMPLYDGKQKDLEIKKISLAEENRLQYRSSFETAWNQQRDQLLEQVRLTEELIDDMNRQVKNQEQLIDLYRVEVNSGLVRWIDFLTVVSNYAQARQDLAGAEISRLLLINQLNYLK